MVINLKKMIMGLFLILALIIGGNCWLNYKAGDDCENSELTAQKELDETGIMEGNDVSTSLNEEKKDDFFVNYRLERGRQRSVQVEMLSNIINSKTAEKNEQQAAAARLVSISADMDKEMKMETLLKARGFRDCAVIIQPDCITAVIASVPLSSEEEIWVKELLCNDSKEKINIIIRDPNPLK